MKESETIVPGLKVRWKGVFSIDELYKSLKQWLDYQGYGNQEKNFYEKRYVEKIKGDSKEINIKWIAQKNVSPYFAFIINISFIVLNLKDIDVEIEGKKIGTNKGEVEVRISSEMIKDRSNRWDSKFMQKIYENFIVKDRLEDYKKDLYQKTYAFHDEIKAYFNMHN